MTPTDTPFAALTLLVAPAILTNASSVAVLATSNRFARAIDRARSLLALIEGNRSDRGERDTESADAKALSALRVRQLECAEKRVLLIIRALKFFYLALGSFAAAAMISLLGATDVFALHPAVNHALLVIGFLTGMTGVCGIGGGAVLLIWESRLTFYILDAEATWVRSRYLKNETHSASELGTGAH